MTTTFKHSGDLGDIIFSLPTIRALGGGTLYLDVNGGQDHPVVQEYCKINGKPRLKFNSSSYAAIEQLLRAQPYITGVYMWDQKSKVDYCLDDFRFKVIQEPNLNLAEAHLLQFGIPIEKNLDPWLTVEGDTAWNYLKIAINRTPRSQGNHAWWDINIKDIQHHAGFLGNITEYDAFCASFGCQIDYIPTAGLWDAARFIKHCDTFIGNTSVLMAIAIGLGKPFYQEVYREAQNNIFKSRDNGKYF